MGYARAGFDVVGVDIEDHADRYPFEFHQADAIKFLSEHGGDFDAIHASPPCQAYSITKHLPGTGGHPELVDVTREGLQRSGRPWIMENVPGAPMPRAVVLCGSMFGLGVVCDDGTYRQLRRHRLFEHHQDVNLWPPYSCSHKGQAIGVYGHGGTSPGQRGRAANKREAAVALGIDWMSRDGLSQSIPPCYTAHLGSQLINQIDEVAA